MNDSSNDIKKILNKIDKRFDSIETRIRKLMLPLDEEAWDIIEYLLKNKGIIMKISRLKLPDIEFDIYGIENEEYCIIGDTIIRATPQNIEEVDKKIEEFSAKYPSYLRKKVIKVVYPIRITQEAVKEAERRGIWIVTFTKDLTPFIIKRVFQ
ncbi:MAG: hypothetical protein QXM88_00010 [Candidatus Nitrosocaldus sp.]